MHTPSFNTWTIVFAVAAIQAMFTAILLFRWKRGSPKGNKLLALLLLLFGITLVEYVMFWTKYMYIYPWISEISTHFPFLFGPILWIYIHHIYGDDVKTGTAIWHLIPFLTGVICWLPWYLLPAEGKLAVQQGAVFPISPYIFKALLWGRIIHLFCYALLIIRYIRLQPAVGQVRKWAVWLSVFFVSFCAAYASYFILSLFPFFNLLWDYHISATMTAFIYLIAAAGYTQETVFEGYNWNESIAFSKYKNSGLTPEASRSLLENLQHLMEQKQLYRQPDLNLDQLAAQLNASKHHVSQVINEQIGASFFEYINHLRILEAMNLLKSTHKQEMNIIEIAYYVGFNNKVSFNTAFRKITGVTPTAFRKNNHQTDKQNDKPASGKTDNFTGPDHQTNLNS